MFRVLHTLRTSRQKNSLYKVYLDSCTLWLWGYQGKNIFCCKNITQILAHFDNDHQDSRWTKLYFQQLRFDIEIQIFLNPANEAISYFQLRLYRERITNNFEGRQQGWVGKVFAFVFLYLHFQRLIEGNTKNLEGGQRGWGGEVRGAVEECAEKDEGG